MTLAKTINSYKDIRRTLDTALANDGGVLELATAGKAIHWRRRAYHYRTLLISAQRMILNPSTPYDDLVMEVQGNYVHIIVREIEGVLRSANGTVLEIVDNAEPVSAVGIDKPKVLVEFDSDGNITEGTKARLDNDRQEKTTVDAGELDADVDAL